MKFKLDENPGRAGRGVKRSPYDLRLVLSQESLPDRPDNGLGAPQVFDALTFEPAQRARRTERCVSGHELRAKPGSSSFGNRSEDCRIRQLQIEHVLKLCGELNILRAHSAWPNHPYDLFEDLPKLLHRHVGRPDKRRLRPLQGLRCEGRQGPGTDNVSTCLAKPVPQGAPARSLRLNCFDGFGDTEGREEKGQMLGYCIFEESFRSCVLMEGDIEDPVRLNNDLIRHRTAPATTRARS